MFENKKILILGMARSGVAAAKTLIKRNNDVIINDIKEESFHDRKTLLIINCLAKLHKHQ